MIGHQQRIALAQRFTEVVVTSPDRVLNLADRIQDRDKHKPELTALCKFGRSMQVRRLRSVAPRNWHQGDYSNAESILEEIDSLIKNEAKPENALALACLGVEVEELDNALVLIGAVQSSEASGHAPVEIHRRPEPQSGKEPNNANQIDQQSTASGADQPSRQSTGRTSNAGRPAKH